MPISLVTGSPGSGKSLFLMRETVEAVKQGRPVYSNVDGLKLDGVDPLPDDWRQCADGAFIVIDEVHQRWPATGKPGRSQEGEIVDLDKHRHRGFDFLIATQYPTKVHHQVREHLGGGGSPAHIHLMRPAGLQQTTLYKWQHAVLDPNDRQQRDAADMEIWRYDKKLFDLYKSATIHTVKRKIPRKIIIMGVVLVLLVGWVVTRIANSDGMIATAFGVASDTSEVVSILQSPVGGVGEGSRAASPEPPVRQRVIPVSDGISDWVFADRLEPIHGCIMNARACRCFGNDGKILDMTDFQCRTAMDRPLPFALPVVQPGQESPSYPG